MLDEKLSILMGDLNNISRSKFYGEIRSVLRFRKFLFEFKL